jgi:hypothetical protein
VSTQNALSYKYKLREDWPIAHDGTLLSTLA